MKPGFAAIAAVAVLGCNGPLGPPHDPDPGTGVDAPPSSTTPRCLADGAGTLPAPPDHTAVFAPHTLRMTRASGAVTLLTGNVAPLGGRAHARIENGKLVIRRGGQIILSTDAGGAVDLAWDIERDGVMYLALFYGNGVQTYQALRLDAAPNIESVWCQAPPNAGLHGIRGGFATAHGPLIVRTNTDLHAIDPTTGNRAWSASWSNAGGPFTLLETGAQSVVCDRDVAVYDQATGTEVWRHALPAGTATECAIVGTHVVYAARLCGAQQCVPSESGSIALATGGLEWSVPNVRWFSLAALDSDRAVVSLPGGVAVLDASAGTVGPTLSIPSPLPWGGELLAGGDVLLYGVETMRVGGAPLGVRWRHAYPTVTRDGNVLLATRTEAQSSTTWLVEIDIATGAQSEREVERRGTSAEVAITEVVGFTPSEVDVVTRFGPLD